MAGLLIHGAALALGVAIGLAILWRRRQRTDVQSPPRPFSIEYALEYERHCEECAREMAGSVVVTAPGFMIECGRPATEDQP